jgi:hypothetical protein
VDEKVEITPKKNRAGLTILVLVITGCLLLSAGLVVGGYFVLKSTRSYKAPTATVGPTATMPTIVEPPTPASPGMTTATPDSQGTGVPPSIAGQMDLIQEQVLGYRGLQLKNPLQRDMMSEEKLKDVVVNDFFKDYTADDAKKDAIELNVLGLLPAGFDLHQFYLDLYSEQIAGYYDSETKEMYVIGTEFKGPERMTYAHEFTHVLQDQNYDLETLLSDEKCDADSEYCAAVTALVEGDATLSEQLWFLSNGTEQDRQEITDFYNSYKSPVYDSAPEYMKQDFLFPYSQGFDFVYSLYGSGKWKAVNAAYTVLPASTEQILHPEKYPDEKPVKIDLGDTLASLGDGWTEYDRTAMGEWYTYLILSQGFNANFRIDEAAAKTASTGWGGDEYIFLINETTGKIAFVWLSTWDSQKDAAEFFDSSKEYGSMRWSNPSSQSSTKAYWSGTPEGEVGISRKGSYILWVISNDADAYTKLSLLGASAEK